VTRAAAAASRALAMPIRVLILGSGAREHALALAIADSPLLDALFALPGNPGIAEVATCLPGNALDADAVLAAAREHRIDLVVVGPEAPLVAGIADALRANGVRVFGPSKAAAELEGSKAFCKRFMKRFGIPTSGFEIFDDADRAAAHLRACGRPMVVKADGIAAGKGVVVADSVEEGVAAIDDMMRRRSFGEAGARVVIEERVAGTEISFHAVCDGERFVTLADAQDHKRIFEGDRGPNTGGMGAYSPTPFVDAAMTRKIVRRVIEPAVAGMREIGVPFTGALFAGLMLGAPEDDGLPSISVLEFNARFGDPETAVLLARFAGDVLALLDAAARGRLDALDASATAVRDDAALAVVVAAAGYPASPRVGDPIEGLAAARAVEGVTVLQAGTARRAGELVSAGGRVLCVTARGGDLPAAAARAYAAVDQLRLAGSQHRRDIGARAGLAR
jgi:phosphoribosylamine--glycine ligase